MIINPVWNSRLTTVMQEYGNCSTDRLLADALILPKAGDPKVLGEALAAVYGYSRSALYLDAARSILKQVATDIAEVNWRMNALHVMTGSLQDSQPPWALAMEQISEAAEHKAFAQFLTFSSEVHWHFYAASLQHCWYFLIHAIQRVDPDFEPTKDEEDYLDLIQSFRNHMEHRDKAAKNLESRDWDSMRKEEQATLVLGYTRDSDGNIEFYPSTGKFKGEKLLFPMNPAGFDKFNAIVLRFYEHLRSRCFDSLRAYFQANPSMLREDHVAGGTFTDDLVPNRDSDLSFIRDLSVGSGQGSI